MAKANPAPAGIPDPPSELDLSSALSAVNVFSRQDLTNITSFDDALRAAQDAFGAVIPIEQTDMGDGFRVATEDDKRRLVGVPLILLEWKWREGDYAEDYCSILAVAQGVNGQSTKWVINDGGTGIAADLRDYERRSGRTGGLLVRNGLRVSDYWTDGETGKPITKGQLAEYHAIGRKTSKGHTFYLDTSA